MGNIASYEISKNFFEKINLRKNIYLVAMYSLLILNKLPENRDVEKNDLITKEEILPKLITLYERLFCTKN